MKRLSLLLVALAACQAPAGRQLSSDLFEDIPAPRGARYQYAKNQSFSYRTPTFRCARFHYEYEGSDANVVSFYRQTMTSPPYNWNLAREEGQAEGSTRLVFQKNEDVCQVDIDRVPRPALERPRNVTILVRVNYNG